MTDLTITLAHDTPAESAIRDDLVAMLAAHDVSRWYFSHDIVIDETARSHSHPVLTLGRHRTPDTPEATLSVFIHEQLHWYTYPVKRAQARDAIMELRAAYPNAPAEPPEGADNIDSTYRHILVCWLEFNVLQLVLGRDTARAMFEAKAQKYYRWVHRTVLADEDAIGEIVRRHDLSFE